MVKPIDIYRRASKYIGLHERTHTQKLIQFFRAAFKQKVDPSTTPWCAAFVNAVLASEGASGTNSLLARSFLKWGKKVTRPIKGDVVVFKRGSLPWQGHVAIYAGQKRGGLIQVLGGNQQDMVNKKWYRENSVLGYRRVSS